VLISATLVRVTSTEEAARREAALRGQAATQHGLITSAQCTALGLAAGQVRERARTGEWRRLCHGVYLIDAHLCDGPAPVDLAVRALLLALGPESLVVLETAAELYGLQGLPPSDGALHVSRPRASRRSHRAGVRVHHLTVPPDQVREVDGLRMTTAIRTLVDLLCRQPRSTAVSLVDSALHLVLIAPDELADVDRLLRGRPGGARARRWLQLADGRAESPLETRVRLAALDGGVPPDELQYPIHDERGVLLGIADMVWKKQRVIAEADGAGPHSEPQALFRDRRRQNDLANAGWTILRFTWGDTLRGGYIAETVQRALKAAA
jgi:very-short-patch-repair endonuclease